MITENILKWWHDVIACLAILRLFKRAGRLIDYVLVDWPYCNGNGMKIWRVWALCGRWVGRGGGVRERGVGGGGV